MVFLDVDVVVASSRRRELKQRQHCDALPPVQVASSRRRELKLFSLFSSNFTTNGRLLTEA